MIRILLADDHEVVRLGLKALIQQHSDLRVVAEAVTGDDAVQMALSHEPDIVLMDIRMPGLSGIEACAEITQRMPGTRVIILTSYAEDDLLLSAIRAGAKGYVLKRIGSVDLVDTVRRVAAGESALDPSMIATVFNEVRQADAVKEASAFSDLSPQEMRILAMIADGATNRDIAARMFLSEGTVRNYVSNLLNKLNVANRAEAAAFAVQHHIKDHLPPE
ncbi:MAG TPA: response regulator transcription factor [Aggregatilineales bacterium]|nr:response regulator transcription factor [Aggregatilineales bacterium]